MVDHIALLPAYCAAGAALLTLLADLIAPGRRGGVLTVAALGTVATGVAAWWASHDISRSAFCPTFSDAGGGDGMAFAFHCSYVWDDRAALIGVVFAAATLAVLAFSVPYLRTGAPAGEYCFLLLCSLAGGVVLGASRDLITLIIALETLTLPLYVLVGLRRQVVASAQAAVTFFVVSVISTAVTLLGAALLYAATGTVHIGVIFASLTTDPVGPEIGGRPVDPQLNRLVAVASVLILVGLAFKVAAVPFHAWAPSTYDGAPLPIAAYLSTASKLGGVIALIVVAVEALRPRLDVVGPALAVVAVLTMTVGNLVALRQRRMVRLLAWSSVAQAGYILAPLGALALAPAQADPAPLVAATLAYTVFYIVLELGAFGSVIALRGSLDGGDLADYAGAARQRPWVSAAFVVALAGLAGLPPGLAGLFAKVTIVRGLLDASASWLALIVAVNAVVGLAYYVRASVALFGSSALPGLPRVSAVVGATLALVTVVALVLGFAPQLVLDAV